MNHRIWKHAAVAGSTVLLFACGGGSGGTSASSGESISGTVVKGPVSGASVTAFAITGGSKGPPVGAGTTDATGAFRLSIGGYAGPLMIQASGGTYTDEATGAAMTMQPGDDMVALVTSVAAAASTPDVRITPLTTMASARARNMPGGMTAANIATANEAVGQYFSVGDILHVMPMDPAVAGSVGADARNYGMAIAAMSQYAHSLGMTSSSGIVTAMADDASDGVMDGMMATSTISMAGMGGMMGGTMQATAGTAGLSAAMGTFISSSMNRSGVTLADMQALMTQVATSGGQLPGAGTGATPQGMMSGTAFMGAMSSGTVTAYAVSGGAMDAPLDAASLDQAGHFTLSLGGYSGTVMLRVTGASFRDPATGTSMTMGTGDVLTSCVASFDPGATTTGVQITPLTSMAQAMAQGMPGGMTAANVGSANTAVGSYFMVDDITGTMPMDPAVAGSTGFATVAARNYGMTIAAMSQYAQTVGMSGPSSAMVTAMTKDASDGVMNGMMGSTPITMAGMGGGMMGSGGMMSTTAGTSGLATAMSTFAGSSMNKSGVTATEMLPLVDKLAASTGTIQ
jgi:hypothetical protein